MNDTKFFYFLSWLVPAMQELMKSLNPPQLESLEAYRKLKSFRLVFGGICSNQTSASSVNGGMKVDFVLPVGKMME